MALRILFFGTPSFAVPTLTQLLASSHHVVGVVSQPDRPRGRGQHVGVSAVKELALEHRLEVRQPERLTDPEFMSWTTGLAPDLGVVAAYGRLLPASLLTVPRLGLINVHASLLPRWRGAAPVHRAILAGDRATGVTIMRVVLALDAGPMLRSEATDIDPNETSVELDARLARLGADLLVKTVDELARGAVGETPQDERLVTLAPRLDRSDGVTDWARPAVMVHNQIRGLQPWPAAESSIAGRRVLLRRSRVDVNHEPATSEAPGSIISIASASFSVATSPGAVEILQLQEAGRDVLDARSFLNGRRLRVGDRFE